MHSCVEIVSRVGNSMSHNVEQYLSDLLGETVTAESRIRLTSGQRARLASWCESNGVSVDRPTIKQAEFKVNEAFDPAASKVRNPTPHISSNELKRFPNAEGQALQTIGIDIQSVDELLPRNGDLKENDEMKHIFSMKEISYAETRSDPRETLAGIFAAKESIRKASYDFLSTPLKEIEILPDENGAPQFAGFSLSISHSAGLAVACAVRHSQPFLSEDPQKNESQVPGETETDSHAAPSPQRETRAQSGMRTRKFALILIATLFVGMSFPMVIEAVSGCVNFDWSGCMQ